MRRILVVGSTGAGKSTLARGLSGRLGLPYHEMDALYFTGAGWAVNEKLSEDVLRITAESRWVIDSIGYPEVRDLMWEQADTVIWLDYPKRVVLPRVLRRSVRRTVTREPLFGGNRETWTGWLSREHPCGGPGPSTRTGAARSPAAPATPASRISTRFASAARATPRLG